MSSRHLIAGRVPVAEPVDVEDWDDEEGWVEEEPEGFPPFAPDACTMPAMILAGERRKTGHTFVGCPARGQVSMRGRLVVPCEACQIVLADAMRRGVEAQRAADVEWVAERDAVEAWDPIVVGGSIGLVAVGMLVAMVGTWAVCVGSWLPMLAGGVLLAGVVWPVVVGSGALWVADRLAPLVRVGHAEPVEETETEEEDE